MQQPKPILIVKIDSSSFDRSYSDVCKEIQDRMPDYYVFAVPFECPEEPVQFQVLNAKDFDELNYEEIKSIIVEYCKTK